MSLFVPFYYLVALSLFIGALPFLTVFTLFAKYRRSIPARFFLWKNPPFEKEGIWYHACSVGEVQALAPLIEASQAEVSLSVVTQTGFARAQRLGKEVRYLPYEIWLPFWIKRPRVLVVMEAELWYLLFWVCGKRGAKRILLNARISDRSWPTYRRFSFFYRHIFAQIDTVFAQSEKDRRRLEALGAKDVVVTGNIKAASVIAPRKNFDKPPRRVVTLASTHKGEERLLLEHLELQKEELLLVVPRHPERFLEVEKLLREYARKEGIRFGRWSEHERFDADVILIDRMGMLIDLYAISDIVLLGGSFVEGVGGHNPLEPAHFGCRILSGPFFFNQQPLYEAVENIKIVKPEELKDLRERMDLAECARIRERVDIAAIMREINGVV